MGIRIKSHSDLTLLRRDELVTTLIPEDIYRKPGAGNPMALQVSRNGNCLCNAVSVLLCGNKSYSHFLRILMADELHSNAQHYASKEVFQIRVECSGTPASVLFPLALSKDSDRDITGGGAKILIGALCFM